MGIANSKTRRAEPRTAADLRERGYKTLSIGRPPNYRGTLNRFGRVARLPMEYKVTYVGADSRTDDERVAPWLGIIKGPSHRSEAHVRLKGGNIARRPLVGGPFESRVAAAHAIIDHLEAEGRL